MLLLPLSACPCVCVCNKGRALSLFEGRRLALRIVQYGSASITTLSPGRRARLHRMTIHWRVSSSTSTGGRRAGGQQNLATHSLVWLLPNSACMHA